MQSTQDAQLDIQHKKKTLSHQHTQTHVNITVLYCSSGLVMHTRTKVRRCPHYRLPEVILPNYPCKAEVTQLDLRKRTAGGKQHVLRLQVTMNHILGVEIAEGCQNLVGRGGEGYAKSCRSQPAHLQTGTWYTKNFVSRSVSLLSGLLRMSSNMSPCIFSMTT